MASIGMDVDLEKGSPTMTDASSPTLYTKSDRTWTADSAPTAVQRM